MANTATALTKIPALFRGSQPKGWITPVLVTFDTIDSDLAIYTPSTGNFAAVVGIQYMEASAHSLIWKSPAATTLITQERAVNTVVEERIGRPLIIGQKSEALLARCGTAAISSMLVYIAEVARLELLSF